MKKFYEVTSSFYDSGRASAAITNIIEADEKPKDLTKNLKKCDVYIDYFDSEEEAKQYIKYILPFCLHERNCTNV